MGREIGVELQCAADKEKTVGDTSHSSWEDSIFGILWVLSELYLVYKCSEC